MRSIRERLQAMQSEPEATTEPVLTGTPIEAVAPGLERTNLRGAHYVIDSTVPDPTRGALAARKHLLPAILDHRFNPGTRFGPSDMLFLDTETTGLDRGTGTHVFLVGLGYFSGSEFKVQQHFLRDLHEEASLLCELEEIVRSFSVLVTFNGRGFDWPLLHNRFILHGYRDIPALTHWDLLTSSRRVWRNRLRDCSLGSLERHILGVQRFGDVPSYLIPDLYFNYLRSRDARPLHPIFSHNLEDIVSLARLAERLLRTETQPLIELKHPVDCLTYGLHLLSRGQFDNAIPLITPHLDYPLMEGELRFRAYRELIEFYKRDRNYQCAIRFSENMLMHHWRGPERALYPLVELAKIYEHRLREFHTAASYCDRALNLANLRDWVAHRESLNHRYARIQRKLAAIRGAMELNDNSQEVQ